MNDVYTLATAAKSAIEQLLHAMADPEDPGLSRAIDRLIQLQEQTHHQHRIDVALGRYLDYCEATGLESSW